jgi:hypothetical protein
MEKDYPKFTVQDDTVNNLMRSIKEIVVDETKDHAIDVGECPYCHGLFGVDWTYLEQVDNVVHCPICCMEVIFVDWE